MAFLLQSNRSTDKHNGKAFSIGQVAFTNLFTSGIAACPLFVVVTFDQTGQTLHRLDNPLCQREKNITHEM